MERSVKTLDLFLPSLFNQIHKNVQSFIDAVPSSLIASNVNLRWKQWKDKELGHAPWLVTLWARKACWTSGMKTRNSITHTNLHKPNDKLVNA
jgi:hypothetical protein